MSGDLDRHNTTAPRYLRTGLPAPLTREVNDKLWLVDHRLTGNCRGTGVKASIQSEAAYAHESPLATPKTSNNPTGERGQ